MKALPAQTWESKFYDHPRQLLGLRISPCGQFAVAGDFDGHIQRWNLASHEQSRLEYHQTWVQALAFHPDRRRLFSTDYWGHIACWPHAEASPRPLWTVAEGHEGWIRAAAVDRAGRQLATAGNDGIIRLWDCDTGRRVRALAGHDTTIYALAFHPDGGLASGDQLGVIKHWDINTGRAARDLDAKSLWGSPEATMSLTGIGGVRSLAFNRDGTRLACGGLHEPNSAGFAAGKPHALVFDWTRGTQHHALGFKEAFEGFVTSLIYHPDGFLIGAGGGKGGAIWFWRGDEEEPFHTVKQLRHIRELDLHPDGIRLAAAAFQTRGQGGNGRRNRVGEYADNSGTVRVYSMTQRPATARPRR